MQQHSRPSVIAAASLAAVLSLAACGERSDEVATGASPTRQRTGEVPPPARQKAGEPAGATRSGSSGAGPNVMGAAREGTGAATADAGQADDGKITSMVLKGLKADKELNPLRIDVDSREGVVTLSGAVPTAAARARAGEIARNVKDVRSVNDQLTVNAS